MTWTFYDPDGSIDGDPQITAPSPQEGWTQPGPSVPPIYSFPFQLTYVDVATRFFTIASPGTLPTLPAINLPFMLTTQPPQSPFWNNENSASCWNGPLYSPNLPLIYSYTPPTRPFPWGSGSSPWQHGSSSMLWRG